MLVDAGRALWRSVKTTRAGPLRCSDHPILAGTSRFSSRHALSRPRSPCSSMSTTVTQFSFLVGDHRLSDTGLLRGMHASNGLGIVRRLLARRPARGPRARFDTMSMHSSSRRRPNTSRLSTLTTQMSLAGGLPRGPILYFAFTAIVAPFSDAPSPIVCCPARSAVDRIGERGDAKCRSDATKAKMATRNGLSIPSPFRGIAAGTAPRNRSSHFFEICIYSPRDRLSEGISRWSCAGRPGCGETETKQSRAGRRSGSAGASGRPRRGSSGLGP